MISVNIAKRRRGPKKWESKRFLKQKILNSSQSIFRKPLTSVNYAAINQSLDHMAQIGVGFVSIVERNSKRLQRKISLQ